MSVDTELMPELCNCLAMRQAARHVTQFYDHHLVPTGIRTTQFSVLRKLKQKGPLTINALAEEMVIDRTTLGRNIQPLEREGLIAVRRRRTDRRSKELHLTDTGLARLRIAVKAWGAAQREFESVFGSERSSELRTILRAVAASDLGPTAANTPEPSG